MNRGRGHWRGSSGARPSSRVGGFTLVEVVLTILIVGVGLSAAMRVFPILLNMSRTSRDTLVAQRLATELMAEIALLPFEDPVGTPAFGPESDEPTATRAAFDDIDDYNGWTASPPQKKDGTLEPNATGYAQSVAVASVDVDNFSLVVSPGSSDAKRITVTIAKAGMPPVVLTTVRLRGANREDGV